jgi:hypothetical protein
MIVTSGSLTLNLLSRFKRLSMESRMCACCGTVEATPMSAPWSESVEYWLRQTADMS